MIKLAANIMFGLIVPAIDMLKASGLEQEDVHTYWYLLERLSDCREVCRTIMNK